MGWKSVERNNMCMVSLIDLMWAWLSQENYEKCGGVMISTKTRSQRKLGNTILVKLELWESVMVIIIFGLPLTYAYATLRQSVAGNSTFRGIVFCNLGTPKQSFQISSPRGKLRPHIFPHMVTPTMFPVDKKRRSTQFGGADKCINSFDERMLSHDRWLWFFFWALTGPYLTLWFGGACGLGVGAF